MKMSKKVSPRKVNEIHISPSDVKGTKKDRLNSAMND